MPGKHCHCELEAPKEALERRLSHGHVHTLLTPPDISPVDICTLLNTELATCTVIASFLHVSAYELDGE